MCKSTAASPPLWWRYSWSGMQPTVSASMTGRATDCSFQWNLRCRARTRGWSTMMFRRCRVHHTVQKTRSTIAGGVLRQHKTNLPSVVLGTYASNAHRTVEREAQVILWWNGDRVGGRAATCWPGEVWRIAQCLNESGCDIVYIRGLGGFRAGACHVVVRCCPHDACGVQKEDCFK